MSTLADRKAKLPVKALIIGKSGAGKTRALASLANAGYRLFVLDFDNGLDILLETVKPEFHKNVYYRECQDKVSGINAVPAPGSLLGCQIAMQSLDAWYEPYPLKQGDVATQLGNPSTWGLRDVLVIDTLTHLGESLKRNVLSLNNRYAASRRPGEQLMRQSDWGEAMMQQENFLARLYSDTIQCNVIVNAHITYIGSDETGGILQGYPSALGNKLPPKVPTYFNSVLMIEKQTMGTSVKGVMRTVASPLVDLKNPAPSKIPPEMEPDLAKYFELIRGPLT